MGNVAAYWEACKKNNEYTESKAVRCTLCPNYCAIPDGGFGVCRVRKNENGMFFAGAYGKVSSVALDPIEKKPLYEFHSGSMILSIGSVGCNLSCPFCQNYSIAHEFDDINLQIATPDDIAAAAVRATAQGGIGVAYTYNEPLINYEFVRDCCEAVKNKGLMNVLVTNGYINEAPLIELLPLIDAMNIDVKGDNNGTYKMVGGTEQTIKRTVELAYEQCHIEITTLAIPEVTVQIVEEIARWLAAIDRKIPYHLSRFFPRYNYKDRAPTPYDKMQELKQAAEKHLEKVYLGNVDYNRTRV